MTSCCLYMYKCVLKKFQFQTEKYIKITMHTCVRPIFDVVSLEQGPAKDNNVYILMALGIISLVLRLVGDKYCKCCI